MYYNKPVSTRGIAGTGSGMLQCAKKPVTYTSPQILMESTSSPSPVSSTSSPLLMDSSWSPHGVDWRWILDLAKFKESLTLRESQCLSAT